MKPSGMLRDFRPPDFARINMLPQLERKKVPAIVPGNRAVVKPFHPRFLTTGALVIAFPDATTSILRASLKFPDPCRDEANMLA